MKFSVILIACNQEDTICAAIESVLQQTYSDLELIYVDDASTDGSVQLVQRRFSDSRLRVICHEENQGCVISRMDGVEQASGDWVLFLDGDDVFLPEACSVLEETIRNAGPGVDLVGFGVEIVCTGTVDPNALQIIEDLLVCPCLGRLSGAELMEEQYLKRNKAWNMWNKCYAMPCIRRAFSSAAREKIVHLEDFYLNFLLCDAANQYLGISRQLHRYSFGNGISNSQSTSLRSFTYYLTSSTSVRLVEEYAKSHGLYEKYSAVIERIGQEVFLGAYYRLTCLREEEQKEGAVLFTKRFGEYIPRVGAALWKTEEENKQQQEDILQRDEVIRQQQETVFQRDRDISQLQEAIRQREEAICRQDETIKQIYQSKRYRLGDILLKIPAKIKQIFCSERVKK